MSVIDNINLLISAPWLVGQAVINGLVIGALFALAAYGMALVWGVMKIINVAQGEFVILGGYTAYFLYTNDIHPLWGLPTAAVLLFILGWLLYRLVIWRIVERDLFTSILATFGISIMIQQLMNLFFGADVQVADAGFDTLFLLDSTLTVPYIRLVTFAVCAVVATALILFMKKSKIGRAIRATAQNARAARVLGIDTDRVYAVTFALNAAICGVAGALVAMTFTIHPYIGLPYTVRSFMIVVVAGLGNLPGVIAAAVGLGTAEELSDYVLGAEFRLAFVFSLLVVILVFRNLKLAKKRLYLK
ncbi:MAG: branched-chain amino acid ABC transporter permease [Candidatus Zeuxoniibacter abyssi]|nr:MAG: branched-chain amino acid ABC transporter permease [Candidatus Persebacteraceae bacterium AB1(2)]